MNLKAINTHIFKHANPKTHLKTNRQPPPNNPKPGASFSGETINQNRGENEI
jgi:hypothetical protein